MNRFAGLMLYLCASIASAQGHGPIYGLSTPTLRRGGWSLDNGVMAQIVGNQHMVMYRPFISYGITQHVQLSASVPVSLSSTPAMAPARVASRMGALNDAELSVGWRFQARELGIGSRYETTAFLTGGLPLDATRAGVATAPSLTPALVTGYVSRSTYLWLGAQQQWYFPGDDRPGHIGLYSAVIGMRPLALQREYPHADWRVFVEFVGEVSGRAVIAGTEQTATGGHQMFLGPTVLGLFGGWGISGGPLFPMYHAMRGSHQKDTVRLALNLVSWF